MSQPKERLLLIVQIASTLLLVAWRVAFHPVQDLWRDWMFVLGIYWMATALLGKSRAWPAATAAVAAYLLVIYSMGQIPQTLTTLGFLP